MRSLYVNSLANDVTMHFRDYIMGGLDDMSTWTNILWRQAAKALVGGTEG